MKFELSALQHQLRHQALTRAPMIGQPATHTCGSKYAQHRFHWCCRFANMPSLLCAMIDSRGFAPSAWHNGRSSPPLPCKSWAQDTTVLYARTHARFSNTVNHKLSTLCIGWQRRGRTLQSRLGLNALSLSSTSIKMRSACRREHGPAHTALVHVAIELTLKDIIMALHVALLQHKLYATLLRSTRMYEMT